MASDCIEWQGPKTKAGYGLTRIDGQRMTASRAAWVRAYGPVPAGLEVCHTCDNRGCVNVAHLWLGTHQQNQADMGRKGRAKGTGRPPTTHCPRSHEYTEANTYVDRRGWHSCKACNAASARRVRAERRALREAA